MNYQQKSIANTQNNRVVYLLCYLSLQDDGTTHNPQDDLINEQEFIEENFNDDDFQTTC